MMGSWGRALWHETITGAWTGLGKDLACVDGVNRKLLEGKSG